VIGDLIAQTVNIYSRFF